jgi:hypothetical protein
MSSPWHLLGKAEPTMREPCWTRFSKRKRKFPGRPIPARCRQRRRSSASSPRDERTAPSLSAEGLTLPCRESSAGWTVASLASKNLTLPRKRSLLREGSSQGPGTHQRWRLPGGPQGHPATGPAISLECGRQPRGTARCGRSTRLPNRGACRDRPRVPVRRRPASWRRRPGTARPARRVPRSHDR